MYTKEPKEYQQHLFQDDLITPLLDKDDPILKISRAIDWSKLSEKLALFYCQDNGRPTKPSRLKIGLLILQRLHKKSDREIVEILKRDIYAQYLCNVSIDKSKEALDHSSLSKFRARLGLEGVKIIEKEVLNALQRAKLLKGRKLILDTTVVPAYISYPTDVSLLEKLRQKTLRYLEEAKEFGAKTYRTYKRKARRVYILFQKIRHHSLKSRRKVQKQLRQFAQRNVQQLKDALAKIEQDLRNLSGEAIKFLEKSKQEFVANSQKFLPVAQQIISQQRDIYQGREVKERIVSLHQPQIRPMVRGKFPSVVEFGPKILLILKNKFLFLEYLCFENISDVHLLEPGIKAYQERFGDGPSQLTTDRGFWSKENYALAQSYKINKIAIENKGKSSYLKDKPFRERLRSLRCSIEAKISLAKRKYGLDRSRYTITNGQEIWVRLGLISMNLNLAFG